MATSSPSTTQQDSAMDSLFEGMPDETVRLALKMAQLMGGKNEQDLKAMLEQLNQEKPSNTNKESSFDSHKLPGKHDESTLDNDMPLKDPEKVNIEEKASKAENAQAFANAIPNEKTESQDRSTDKKSEGNRVDTIPENNEENKEKLNTNLNENVEPGKIEDIDQNVTVNNTTTAKEMGGNLNKRLQQTATHKGHDEYVVSSDDDLPPSTPVSDRQSSQSELSESPTEKVFASGNIQSAAGNQCSPEKFPEASPVIIVRPEIHQVNYKASPTSSAEEKVKDLLYISSQSRHQGTDLLKAKQSSWQVHGKVSDGTNNTPHRGQYEEFPSLPAEIKEPTLQSSPATFNDATTTSQQTDNEKEKPSTVTSLTISQTSTTITPQVMTTAIMSAKSLPSIPLYYQPHIVMKDNIPVLMLKPVLAPNISGDLNHSIDFNGSSMVFPLPQTVQPGTQVHDINLSSDVENDEKTNTKDLGLQLPDEYSAESDLEERYPSKGHEEWPTWTGVSIHEERLSQPRNPFLDESATSTYSNSIPRAEKPNNNFGYPVPSNVYHTTPSSNPFNPEEPSHTPSEEVLSRTNFKTIPKSMLAGQSKPRGPPVCQMSGNDLSPRAPPITQDSSSTTVSWGPSVSQTNGNTMQPHRSVLNPAFVPRGSPASQLTANASSQWGPSVSQQSGTIATPRGSLVSQQSGITPPPQGPSVSQQSGTTTQPRQPLVSQQRSTPINEANVDSTPLRRRLSSGSMVTLLEVADNGNTQSSTQTPGEITQVSTTIEPINLSSASSNFTTAHMTSVGHDSNGVTADPCINAVVNIGHPTADSQPTREAKPKMPGHVAPYWVPDDEVFKCAYCHLKFTLMRRKHHCRGCGKIFCSNCCSQLARLSYLQYQIGRICINCTNIIKEFRKQKKNERSRSPQSNNNHKTRQVIPSNQRSSEVQSLTPSSSSSMNQESSHSLYSKPSSPNQTQLVYVPPVFQSHNNGYQPSTHTSGAQQATPSSSTFRPLDMVQSHAVAMETPTHQIEPSTTSHDPASQSFRSPTVPKQTLHDNVTQSQAPMDRQERSAGYSELKLPLRPAGRIVSWKGESFASRLLAQDRRKALARDLRELPHGVTMQLSDDLQVIVRKVKVQSNPLVQAWCCNSVGLKSFDQNEIAMHFKIRPKEDVVPEEILRMYKVILDLVKLGHRFQHSNFLAFKSPFLGTSDNAALIFASSALVRQPKAFGESRPDRLYAILVKRSELEYAQYTPTRFLLRLGQEFKSFPFPVLNSRDRAVVYDGVDPGDMIYTTSVALNNHLKNSVPEAIIPGLTVLQEDSKVVLQLSVESQPTVVNFFDRLIVKTNQTATIPLVSDLSTNVDQYRVYHQSIHTDEISLRKHMSLFRNPLNPTHHGIRSVTGLGFILLLLGARNSPVLEQRGKLVDDGVIVHLSDLHTQKLRQCLHDRCNCHFYLGDHFEILYFELRWLQDPLSHPRTDNPGTKSIPQEPQMESCPGSATIDVRHSGHSSELKKMAEARLGDVLILVRVLEQRIKQASTEALMMQANRMKAGETKELVLKLSLRDGLKKWSIGPANQPMGLIRSLQMALYDVKLSDLGGACLDLSFDVTIIKQFDLIAQRYEEDLVPKDNFLPK